MSAHVALLAVLVACYVTGHVGGRCRSGRGSPTMVWENNNITCPFSAFCADVFDYPNWCNKLVHSRCLCNGGTVCPYESPDHRLYGKTGHEIYTCRPVCTKPYCPDLERQYPDKNRTAKTRELDSPNFNYGHYDKINCRCPRNHVEPAQRRWLAYEFYKGQYNSYRLRALLFRCDQTDAEAAMPDPCDQ